MICAIHRPANLAYAGFDSTGGLIVDDQYGFEGVAFVRLEACFNIVGVDFSPLVARHKVGMYTHSLGEILPES